MARPLPYVPGAETRAPRTKWIKRPYEDLSGRTFGLLSVKERASRHPTGTLFRCICQPCGKEVLNTAYDLVEGNRHTCGEWACRRAWMRAKEAVADASGIATDHG